MTRLREKCPRQSVCSRVRCNSARWLQLAAIVGAFSALACSADGGATAVPAIGTGGSASTVGGSSADGTEIGGANSGGSSPIDTSYGGSNAGGSGTGGKRSSGPNTGGVNTSATSSSGANMGGANTGGKTGGSTGGANTGGKTGGSTGGVNTGGGNTGGASTGGASTGGRNTGGAGTGGQTSGSTGGVGTGGSTSGCGKTGFYVEGKSLYDKNCNEFIPRGVNYPYSWFSNRNTQTDFNSIAGTGANIVRVVMSTGARWTRTSGSVMTNIITAAKSAKLVVVAEVHDTTGWTEQSGSVDLANATTYWTSSDIMTAMKGQEAYVLINMGNEPMGNGTTNEWVPRHVAAVTALRNAGLRHTLIADAPNWGQDWENTMRNGAGVSIWDADTDKNMMFSVHMYDAYGTAATVSTYMSTFLSNYAAPLLVGEFAADHGSGKNVDEDAVMSNAESLGVGYIGWAWAGNGADLATLNITNNFNASSLTTWGDRLINGANGIKATAKVCTCFN